MKLTVYFKNEQEIVDVRVSMKSIVRKAIFNTLIYEGFDKDAELSVTFTDNEQIKELNKEYRNKNSATDVLSFPMYDDFSAIDGCPEPVPLGDIVISLERAMLQGHHLCHSTYHEVAFLTVHSTLHLLGYDHETSKEDEKDMFRRQKEIMEIIGF
ncbi:MAG: rRNA maturation RNase YbeY [Clostridia bacterium]|nr:rRNA maturation RNase YbeY [Clostridia bacterium]MBQ7788149.1 rRNA maturation RNase YbeY [Clostridia bacterium]